MSWDTEPDGWKKTGKQTTKACEAAENNHLSSAGTPDDYVKIRRSARAPIASFRKHSMISK